MILQQKRYWNLNIYLRTLFYFIFHWSVNPLISSTRSGPQPECDWVGDRLKMDKHKALATTIVAPKSPKTKFIYIYIYILRFQYPFCCMIVYYDISAYLKSIYSKTSIKPWYGLVRACKSFINLIKLVSTRTCSSARVRAAPREFLWRPDDVLAWLFSESNYPAQFCDWP